MYGPLRALLLLTCQTAKRILILRQQGVARWDRGGVFAQELFKRWYEFSEATDTLPGVK